MTLNQLIHSSDFDVSFLTFDFSQLERKTYVAMTPCLIQDFCIEAEIDLNIQKINVFRITFKILEFTDVEITIMIPQFLHINSPSLKQLISIWTLVHFSHRYAFLYQNSSDGFEISFSFFFSSGLLVIFKFRIGLRLE